MSVCQYSGHDVLTEEDLSTNVLMIVNETADVALKTIRMLNWMIVCGDGHSAESEETVENAIELLRKLE